MKPGQKLWTRDELLLAINLYCKLTFGQFHGRNPEVIKLAELLGRTANSVALKLSNFASLDPSLSQAGMSNASKLDREVWNEFYADWSGRAYESEKLLAEAQHITVEELEAEYEVLTPLKIGREKEQTVKVVVLPKSWTVQAGYLSQVHESQTHPPSLHGRV